ncbi:hypothetical protein BDQ17DRAFT_830360 [Cyathus striatus]|nr:hypothetical protein BDQ17DRAFT_830360 [Cyathus striatus]
MRFALPALLLLLPAAVLADPSAGAGGLYPPGLLPLINRANILLSTGQFNEAAKLYSEAIDQSPTDYLLYYKRATALHSLQRHSAALEDYDKVLSLTSQTFDSAHLSKARIHLKEGYFPASRTSLARYIKAKGRDADAVELEKDLDVGEKAREQAEKERRAELWSACVESSTRALGVASFSVEIRAWRVECSFASGDLEGSVGDLTRLTHLLPPSTKLLTHLFSLSYFLLPASPSSLSALKQCLHYDPDSKPCLVLHRLYKSFDRAFTQIHELEEKEDWRGIIKLLSASPGGKKGDIMAKFDTALREYINSDALLPLIPTIPTSAKSKNLPVPNPLLTSPLRQDLLRALCKSYTRLADTSKGSEYVSAMSEWCEALLGMTGNDGDVDGLIGRAEMLLRKEEWEDAVRVLEKAFEESGRSDRQIHARLQKAQKLLKQSRQKDYYKVLGVSRDADARDIKKALYVVSLFIYFLSVFSTFLFFFFISRTRSGVFAGITITT